MKQGWDTNISVCDCRLVCVSFLLFYFPDSGRIQPHYAAVLRRRLSAAALNTVTNILDSGGNQA